MAKHRQGSSTGEISNNNTKGLYFQAVEAVELEWWYSKSNSLSHCLLLLRGTTFTGVEEIGKKGEGHLLGTCAIISSMTFQVVAEYHLFVV